MKQISGGVCAAQGFAAAGIHCGVRKSRTKKDLALIASAVPASSAAVYTTNLVKGAPLTVTKAPSMGCPVMLSVTMPRTPLVHCSI